MLGDAQRLDMFGVALDLLGVYFQVDSRFCTRWSVFFQEQDWMWSPLLMFRLYGLGGAHGPSSTEEDQPQRSRFSSSSCCNHRDTGAVEYWRRRELLLATSHERRHISRRSLKIMSHT